MALRLSWWFGGMAVGCAAIAVAFLPPHGMQLFGAGFRWRMEPNSPLMERRMALASKWQMVDGQIRAIRLRREAEPMLAAQRAAGEPQRVAVFEPDTSLDTRRRYLQPAFDSAWRQLKLGDSKIAIVLASPARTQRLEGPGSSNWWKTYLLPDSTDRTTCVVVYPTFFLDRQKPRPSEMQRYVRAGLGPCAFYARFGAPSPRVRRWLEVNKFDVAENADWYSESPRQDIDDEFTDWTSFFGAGSFYWYANIYEMPFNTVACVAGRIPACLSAWRHGDSEDPIPLSRSVTPGELWKVNQKRLPDQPFLLTNLFKQVGENTFQEFWTTSLPIDSALAIALDAPAGEWIAQQKEATNLHLRLGPVPPWPSMLFAVLVAGALLTFTAFAVRYRQVR